MIAATINSPPAREEADARGSNTMPTGWPAGRDEIAKTPHSAAPFSTRSLAYCLIESLVSGAGRTYAKQCLLPASHLISAQLGSRDQFARPSNGATKPAPSNSLPAAERSVRSSRASEPTSVLIRRQLGSNKPAGERKSGLELSEAGRVRNVMAVSCRRRLLAGGSNWPPSFAGFSSGV